MGGRGDARKPVLYAGGLALLCYSGLKIKVHFRYVLVRYLCEDKDKKEVLSTLQVLEPYGIPAL